VTPPGSHTTIWLDLTDLEGWDGPVTGIQRVSLEHLRRFAAADGGEAGPEVRGFVFRGGPDRFVPADFVIDANTVHVRVAGESESTDDLVTPTASLRGKVVAVARRVPAVERVARAVRARVRPTRRYAPTAPEPPVPFAAHDTVVVLGGNWLVAGWAPLLERVHARVAVRVVHVVHDLVPVLAPQWAAPGAAALQGPYLEAVLRVADVVVAVSQATADDVERFVQARGIARPRDARTTVVRHGSELGASGGVGVVPAGVDPAEPFVLCVGTIEIRKNHALVYQAYALAAERGVELPKLYLVGRRGWLADSTVHLLTEDPVVSPKVVLLGPCDDPQLAWLYEHCRYTVYPSFAEGWGLPVAESVAHSKVCITCDRSSLPEVAGEYADYVSAFDAASLLDRMMHYADDAVLEARERDLRTNFHPRSWDDAFAELRAAIGRPGA
jgi:glycosyltransferase involved in cell wall biosynthesis